MFRPKCGKGPSRVQYPLHDLMKLERNSSKKDPMLFSLKPRYLDIQAFLRFGIASMLSLAWLNPL